MEFRFISKFWSGSRRADSMRIRIRDPQHWFGTLSTGTYSTHFLQRPQKCPDRVRIRPESLINWPVGFGCRSTSIRNIYGSWQLLYSHVSILNSYHTWHPTFSSEARLTSTTPATKCRWPTTGYPGIKFTYLRYSSMHGWLIDLKEPGRYRYSLWNVHNLFD